ncbi:MAG: hypothetical protein ACTSQJ_06160 [Promethearchaeota archaeon]
MYEKHNDYDVTLEALKSFKKKEIYVKEQLSRRSCFLGFDGYIDSLYSICQTRESPTEWTKMESMRTFGELLVNVAGSSANVERVLKRKISGGFAPNSCKAINGLGLNVYLIAALGYPEIDKNFIPITTRNSVEAISFANPGETIGLEFDDGKVMLTDFENILNIDWDLIVERVGFERIFKIIEKSDILGFGHWSLVPHLGEIWQHFLYDIFPSINKQKLKKKLFFVDLADIKKRNKTDINNMLVQLNKIDNYVPVMLSLNDQEAIDISKALDKVKNIRQDKENFIDFIEGGKLINNEVKISFLVIHSPHFATISTLNNHYWITEGFTAKPRYTTGAGDHFHSGVAAGLACQLTPPESLLIGNSLTAIFVRTGNSPNFTELSQFIDGYLNYIEVDNPNFP